MTAAPAEWPLPRWIAHRGAGKLAPENTLAAFRVGASFGYRAFECDVKLSADGVPFLLHDATLERTTNAQGTAGVLPWDVLSRLDAGSWHSRQFAGEPPPSLAAIAAYVQRNGFALNIEIKPTPGQELETGRAVGRACAALWGPKTVARAPLVFSSFRPEALQGVLETSPNVPRGLLLDTLWKGWPAVASALGCKAVITNHTLMDAPLRARLRQMGVRALCYTVNTPGHARRLLRLDIDGLITDAIDRFSPHAGPHSD